MGNMFGHLQTRQANQSLLMGSFIQYGKNNLMEAGNMYGIDHRLAGKK
jgi:hypothetical protein